MTSGRYRLLLTVCWLTIQVLAHGQPPSPSAAQPKRLLSTQELQNLLSPPNDKACLTKLAEYNKWYAENKPLNDAAVQHIRQLEARLAVEERDLSVGLAAGFGGVGALCIVVALYWKRFVPKTARGKQLCILLPAVGWSTFCILGIANDMEMMRHPINAAVTALFWVSPALLFGGLLFWWFSPERSRPSSPDKQLSAPGTGN